MNAVPVAGVSVLASGIEKAWLVLPAVYDSLGIPRSKVDRASYTIGNLGMQVRRRLGNVRLSKYLDCGTTQQGLGARVVNGSIVRDPGGRQVAFKVTDGAKTYDVVYRGITPDTFTDDVDVVLEGRLGRDGTFRATTLLAKCASRYENAPEKYKDTPGYKKAEQSA